MSKKQKSWQEKLADSKGLPKVVEINDKMSKRWGTGTVVIPAPIEVDEIMKQVPRGRVTIAGSPNHDVAPGTLNSILKQAKLKE